MEYKLIDLSVVIAAYNEEQIIENTIKEVVDVLKARNLTCELLVVNDGSKDQTGKIIDRYADKESRIRVFHHWRNYGQGRALRTGFRHVRGKIIVTLDADLSYSPQYIWMLYDKLKSEEAEVVLASPYMKNGSVKNVPLGRYLLSKWGNKYLSKMSRYSISTATCVVRAYRREVIEELYLSSDGMELQFEILVKANNAGFNVLEIPATLCWKTEAEAQGLVKPRKSKMKILRSIKLYMYYGWLSKPAYAFIVLSSLLLLPGCYMALWLVYQASVAIRIHILAGDGIRWGISNGLAEVFKTHTYSFTISTSLIIVGIQMLVFALLTMQNKYYFDETHKLAQKILKKMRVDP